MYTDEDLYAAVKEGIFDKDSVDKFRHYIAGASHTQIVDEENFRLISGFNDIFVAIASLLLMISAGWIGAQLSPSFGFLISAILSWILSVYFVIRRKLALPAILFLISFVVGCAGSVFLALQSHSTQGSTAVLLASGAGALTAWIHWLKFRVPITVAAGMASLSICVIFICITQFPLLMQFIDILIAICGFSTFFVAMYWDALDTERKSRKSDVAFWLHLLAAPMIVHPIFSSLGILRGEVEIYKISLVIASYFFLGVISIAVDRRALMVSSLIYVLYAFTALFKKYGVVSYSFSVSGVIIGSMLLFLSAFWHKARHVLMKYLSPSVRRLLPETKERA